MKWLNRIKFEQAGEDGNKGGSSGSNPPQTPPPAPTEAEGGQFDDFGYPKVEAPVQSGKETESKKETPPAPKEVEKPVTGYGAEPPKEEPPKAPEAPPPPKIDLGFELETKDLDEGEATKLKEFIKANALPKEAAQALVNLKKDEIGALKKAQSDYQESIKREVATTKANWDKELRNHAEFGGEKFASNIKMVERVLEEFMPETKKILTERASMLPPYVMRDFAKLANHLYGTEKLVQGDKAGEAESDKAKDNDDPLAFYR